MQAILSKKKTDIHGLKSRRWTVFDKVEQYKGLLKLYGRDKKIFINDTNKDCRLLKKEIIKLRDVVNEQREELQNAIKGDRQRLRNTLAEDQSLMLAYQNMHPTKVIEVLNQECFNKKKYLDRIFARTKQKTEELVKLKLLYAEFEDRMKYESKEKIPEEETAMMITAKVEDAVMKIQTASDVKDTYKNILTLLKKDSIYFDVVLVALQVDGFKQGRCLCKLTEMGQLASEYLDDRRTDYLMLENVLKMSMVERRNNIKDIRRQIEGLHNNVKFLIRRDSIMMMDEDSRIIRDSSNHSIGQDIESISRIFDQIIRITAVSQVNQLFPRFEEQRNQKERLEDLVTKTVKERDTLLNKCQHAEEMYNSLNHTQVESTLWYKDQKERINTTLHDLTERNTATRNLIRVRGTLFCQVRQVLQQMVEVLRNVTVPPEKTDVKKRPLKPSKVAVPVKSGSPEKPHSAKSKAKHDKEQVVVAVKPEHVPEDSMELLAIISKKLPIILKDALPLDAMDPTATDIAGQYYEKFVCNMISSNVIDTTVREQALIEEDLFEDALVPSRFEVKRISAEICEKNAKSEFEL